MHKLAFLGVVVALALPGAVLAHSNPETGQPAINGSSDSAVASVTLTFDSPVVPSATSLHVLDEHGARVDSGPTSVDAGAKAATVPTASLDKGIYTVLWANQSAEDGHENQGYYIFAVAGGDPQGKVAFAGSQSDASGSSVIAKAVNDMRLRLQTTPGGLGLKAFDVSLSDMTGAPISGAFVRLRSKLSSVPGFPDYYKVTQPAQGIPSRYTVALPIGIEGSWTLTVTISRDGKPDAELAVPLLAAAGLQTARSAAPAGFSASPLASQRTGLASAKPPPPGTASSASAQSTSAPSAPAASSSSQTQPVQSSQFPVLPVLGIVLLLVLLLAVLRGPWRHRP